MPSRFAGQLRVPHLARARYYRFCECAQSATVRRVIVDATALHFGSGANLVLRLGGGLPLGGPELVGVCETVRLAMLSLAFQRHH